MVNIFPTLFFLFIFRVEKMIFPALISKEFINLEWINWKNNCILSTPSENSTDVSNFFKEVW